MRTRREARESLARRSERDARASARDSTRSITQPTMLPPLPRRPAPFLTNLSADPQQTGKLVFYLKAGFTHIGREMAPEAALAPAVDAPTPRAAGSAKPKPQATAVGSAAPVVGAAHCIVLNSNAIRPRHARVHNANGVCSISPEVGAAVFINGKLLGSGWHADARVRGADESGDDDGEVELGSTSQGYVLEHGDRVILGMRAARACDARGAAIQQPGPPSPFHFPSPPPTSLLLPSLSPPHPHPSLGASRAPRPQRASLCRQPPRLCVPAPFRAGSRQGDRRC